MDYACFGCMFEQRMMNTEPQVSAVHLSPLVCFGSASAVIVCMHALTHGLWVWVGGCDWSSSDWVIYRIFAQWLARGQTTGALGPVGVDLSSGSSGSLTVTPCDEEKKKEKYTTTINNNNTDTSKNIEVAWILEWKKRLGNDVCVCAQRDQSSRLEFACICKYT